MRQWRESAPVWRSFYNQKSLKPDDSISNSIRITEVDLRQYIFEDLYGCSCINEDSFLFFISPLIFYSDFLGARFLCTLVIDNFSIFSIEFIGKISIFSCYSLLISLNI